MKLLGILLLSSFSILALDINDTMPMRIYDILSDNQISISRGFSDGIEPGDHLKINNSDGYKARAIVIYSQEDFSILKLYRVIKSDSLSRDDRYILTSMRSSLIAPHMRRFIKKDYREIFADFKPKKSSKPISVQYDLPSRTTPKEIKSALNKPR